MYNQSILFISDYSKWSQSAYQYIQSVFSNTVNLFYERGDFCIEVVERWQGDWIFSFKSELVLSQDILKKAKYGALNFHPSPPKYRGIGGYILALKNADKKFGVTCHHMNKNIDSGQIIMTNYFDIQRDENVLSLYHKTAFHCLELLFKVVEHICLEKELPLSNEIWGDDLYKYNEFKDDLRILRTVEIREVRNAYNIIDAVGTIKSL
jgi:methionyl-tRNA formyltransferase